MSFVRRVRVELGFEVKEAARVIVQIRPARSAGSASEESFRVRVDGQPVEASDTIDTEYGGTLHDVAAVAGELLIEYQTELAAVDRPLAPIMEFGGPALEQHRMLRPSRYCPSDHVGGLAMSEFGQYARAAEKVAAIASWIHDRVEYLPGSSDVHDSAENTLLTGQGVCRDFAHLGIVLCRALDVPARFVSVYAPGLDPMDFHAVFEAWHDNAWWVYDPTRLAPRQSLTRIATGRDAADASFATVAGGIATLTGVTVTATADGDLPIDQHDGLVVLA